MGLAGGLLPPSVPSLCQARRRRREMGGGQEVRHVGAVGALHGGPDIGVARYSGTDERLRSVLPRKQSHPGLVNGLLA